VDRVQSPRIASIARVGSDIELDPRLPQTASTSASVPRAGGGNNQRELLLPEPGLYVPEYLSGRGSKKRHNSFI